MVLPLYLNFRKITAKFSGVRKFRNLMVLLHSGKLPGRHLQTGTSRAITSKTLASRQPKPMVETTTLAVLSRRNHPRCLGGRGSVAHNEADRADSRMV